jgi:heme exporter protein D
LKKTGNLVKRIRIGRRTIKILIKVRISLFTALALIVCLLILIINIITALERKAMKREGKSRRKRKAESRKAFIYL